MVNIDSQLSSVVSLAGVSFINVNVTVEEPSLDGPLAEVEHRLRTASTSDDMTKAVRQMYRRCRIDPTKTRPSSEALLRRVRRCLLYTSPSPRDVEESRMPSSA